MGVNRVKLCRFCLFTTCPKTTQSYVGVRDFHYFGEIELLGAFGVSSHYQVSNLEVGVRDVVIDVILRLFVRYWSNPFPYIYDIPLVRLLWL